MPKSVPRPRLPPEPRLPLLRNAVRDEIIWNAGDLMHRRTNRCAGFTMEEENEDQRQFFKDLGATAEQTVQEVRGLEESCYNLAQWTIPALPWLADLNKKLQTYTEENFAAAYKFARDLSEAKDMQDFGRIQAEYFQKCAHSFAAQMQDLAETYKHMTLGATKAPSIPSQ